MTVGLTEVPVMQASGEVTGVWSEAPAWPAPERGGWDVTVGLTEVPVMQASGEVTGVWSEAPAWPAPERGEAR